MQRIVLTSFALRQWDAERAGTRIVGLKPEELVRLCNDAVCNGAPLIAGYAPFCKHLFLDNPSPTRAAFAPITEANRHLLVSGYKARRAGELAVLERWFEGLDAPQAAFLDVILYAHAQLVAEAAEGPAPEDVPECDWGIVSIIGTLEPSEPPIPPITQMRNALGRAEGGSGVAIDGEAYLRAVTFWERHASVR